MRPNPLFTTGETPTEPSATVTQLKIAARGREDRGTSEVEDLRHEPHAGTLAVIDGELRRSHGEWRRTLDTVRETLATLERTCESAIETHEAGIAGLVATLAGTAKEEALAAAQQTRAQAETEIEGFRQALAGHEVDLQEARGAVKSANEQLDIERAARARAESERDAAQRINQQIASQLQTARDETDSVRAELARLQKRLEAESADRSRLMTTFQAVQNALSLAQSGDVEFAPVTLEGRPQEVPRDARSDAAPAHYDCERSALADPVVEIEPFPEVVEHAKRLLEQAEAMYRTDLDSGRPPIEVVDRLAAILRYSRDLVIDRWRSDVCDAAAVFEREISALLDAKAETSFGRHLSIATFASRSSEPPAAS
jgi:hypothetical protein